MPVRLLATILAAALTFGSTAATQKPEQAEALLQKAAQRETVDGDLKAAIDLYKQAVAAPAAIARLRRGPSSRWGMLREARQRRGAEGLPAGHHELRDQAEAVARASARLVRWDRARPRRAVRPARRPGSSSGNCDSSLARSSMRFPRTGTRLLTLTRNRGTTWLSETSHRARINRSRTSRAEPR